MPTSDEQLKQVISELREVQSLRDNLKTTQERCNELLEEIRKERKLKAQLESALRETLIELEGFLSRSLQGKIEDLLEIKKQPYKFTRDSCENVGHSFGHGEVCHYCGYLNG